MTRLRARYLLPLCFRLRWRPVDVDGLTVEEFVAFTDSLDAEAAEVRRVEGRRGT